MKTSERMGQHYLRFGKNIIILGRSAEYMRILVLICSFLMVLLMFQPLVVAKSDLSSVKVHPTYWTRMQGDAAVYIVLIMSSDKIRLDIQGLPSDISAKFSPPSGQSITGIFASKLTLSTRSSTTTKDYFPKVIATQGANQKQVTINLKIVPRTPEGARLVLYDAYAKYLNPYFWEGETISRLALYSSEFGTSFTNPFSILKRFVTEIGAQELSTAESLISSIGTIIGTLSSSGMTYILSNSYSKANIQIKITEDRGIEPLVKISSLIEQGDKKGAISEINKLLPQLRRWLGEIEKVNVDGLVVTSNNKEAARKLMSSCIYFLEAELKRLQDTQPPSVRVISPNGGETLRAQQTTIIKWQASDNIGVTEINLYYSLDGGKTWNLIAEKLRNTGSYSWRTPIVSSQNCLVRVDAYDMAGNRGNDVSDRPFIIRR